jgi:general secretion pathway protein D
MKPAALRPLVFAACLAATLGAFAQPPAQQPQPGQPPVQPSQQTPSGPPLAQPAIFPGLPTVPLQPLLDRVSRESKKQFLVDGRIGTEVFLGGARQEDVTYPLLLSILRANGLGAVEIEGRVNVVPQFEVRFYASQIVPNDDDRVAADEWITRIVTTTNVDAALLVPILRPLLPQAAHLAAVPPSHLIVMDRYANVQRITAIVRSLDQPGSGRPRE